MPIARAAGLGLLTALLAAPAAAQDLASIFGRDTLHGMAEVRFAGSRGETSWTDGGFGKSDVEAGTPGWRSGVDLSQAVVEWKPRFSFALSAVVSAQWQAKVAPRLDLDEAYLKLKSPPSALGRLSGRAGVFYPPVSLEHEGLGWTTTDLISASTLNSWIGEEVKVGGLEATLQQSLGDHQVSATAGLFGWNDTSGTLVSFRGWATHELRTGWRSEFPLPPLTPFMSARQADETYPNWELDRRAGWYGKLEWRPPTPLVLQAFHYDNGGDRRAVKDLQWSWETRFTTVSLDWRPDESTRIRAQALTGRTWMGYPFPETWVDVGFHSAYVMGVRQLGPGAASLRFDAFEAQDKTLRKMDGADEHGWAITGGWRQALTPWADLLLEAQSIRSDRPGRALAGAPAKVRENVLQSAVRLHF